MPRRTSLAALLVAGVAVPACGEQPEGGVEAPEVVVHVVRASGLCGDDPVIVEFEQAPGHIEARCVVSVPFGTGVRQVTAVCADGDWRVSGYRDEQSGGPCGRSVP